MRQYVILIERGPRNLSAFVPSLPGCVATGKTRQQVIDNMYEAIQFHLDGMVEDGDPIPEEDLEAVTLVVPEPGAQLAGEMVKAASGD
jgi:predicted RNase H-like HicB family nuclease